MTTSFRLVWFLVRTAPPSTRLVFLGSHPSHPASRRRGRFSPARATANTVLLAKSYGVGAGPVASSAPPGALYLCRPGDRSSAAGAKRGGIERNRRVRGHFGHLAQNGGDTRDGSIWFGTRAGTNPPTCRGFAEKRLMGFEPTTFCMAIRPISETSGQRICPLAGGSQDGDQRPRKEMRGDVRRYAAIWELRRRSARNARGRFHCQRGGPGPQQPAGDSAALPIYGAASPTRPYRSSRRMTSSSCGVETSMISASSTASRVWTTPGELRQVSPGPNSRAISVSGDSPWETITRPDRTNEVSSFSS